ncbi:MAG: hypothetical protein VX715_07800, partial [Planctomycetota bacterium]|nr:hypothetical protein [Planctomycetota bacterium]
MIKIPVGSRCIRNRGGSGFPSTAWTCFREKLMKIPASLLLVTFMFPSLAMAAGESPRTEGASVELVSDGFELADGPSWDGSFALYIPDVRAK